MTGGHNTRVSLAALIAVKPGRRPRLIYRVHRSRAGGKDRRKGFTEADYAQLLDAAHQQLGGPLVVVWDNLNTHVSAAMTELIAARDWLTVCQLPPYAHELNPVGLVWSHLKRSLANLAKRNISQLTALVKTRLKRMQYRPGLLDGFLASTRLDLTPPPLRIGQATPRSVRHYTRPIPRMSRAVRLPLAALPLLLLFTASALCPHGRRR